MSGSWSSFQANIKPLLGSSGCKVAAEVLSELPPFFSIGHFLNYHKIKVTPNDLYHGLQTPWEEMALTERPKIHSHSQIFRYGQRIFCLPHRPNFSDIFDLCFHWVSVVGGQSEWRWSNLHHSKLPSTLYWIRTIKLKPLWGRTSNFLSSKLILHNFPFVDKWTVLGGFQLIDLIITELKSHMTC